MDDIEIGYAAGLFDGEGSISITKRTVGRITPMYMVQVQISMRCKEVPEWFANHFGGSALVYKQGKHALGNGNICKWVTAGHNAQSFLEVVVPYLIEKRKQAEVALEFPIGMSCMSRQFSPGEIGEREYLYNVMKDLHTK